MLNRLPTLRVNRGPGIYDHNESGVFPAGANTRHACGVGSRDVGTCGTMAPRAQLKAGMKPGVFMSYP